MQENGLNPICRTKQVLPLAAEGVKMSNKLKSETPVVQPRLVRRFEVMNRIGEHEWEEACGPFKTYEEAEKARLNWFRKDEIPSMLVVEFYPPNTKLVNG
jgi:hypothetical protein